MKALLPENDDFLNCTVLESLLEYASSIPLYSEILVPHNSTLKLVWLLNHVKKLKDSKQDSLLLVYKYQCRSQGARAPPLGKSGSTAHCPWEHFLK